MLQKSLDTNCVSHAYLFSGPGQIGKLTLAREFAKALNCAEPDPPCGRCRSCRKIDRSAHPDVQIIEPEDGSKSIGIEAVRALQDGIALRPYEGRVKVYVIGEAERLSEAAANCMLKTLEEPPPSVVLLLTTQDATMPLPTLVSRCQQIELRPVPIPAVEAALLQRYGMPPDRAKLLATLSRGRVGWAIRAASDAALLGRRKELLERLVALPAAGYVARFAYAAELAALHARDPDAAREVLEMWQLWWRDLLLYRLGLGELLVNVDLRDRLASEAERHSLEALNRMVRSVQETISLLAQNVNARLALEVLMLSVPHSSGPVRSADGDLLVSH